MNNIDYISNANEEYAKNFKYKELKSAPNKKIAILACMDARLCVEEVLGLDVGDAHIIRNAGGIATDDAIRSLIISHELLGTEEIFIINHTDCGMQKFKDKDLQNNLTQKYNSDASVIRFYSFPDLEVNVKRQIDRLKNIPFLRDMSIQGLVYDVKTGKINKVDANQN